MAGTAGTTPRNGDGDGADAGALVEPARLIDHALRHELVQPMHALRLLLAPPRGIDREPLAPWLGKLGQTLDAMEEMIAAIGDLHHFLLTRGSEPSQAVALARLFASMVDLRVEPLSIRGVTLTTARTRIVIAAPLQALRAVLRLLIEDVATSAEAGDALLIGVRRRGRAHALIVWHRRGHRGTARDPAMDTIREMTVAAGNGVAQLRKAALDAALGACSARLERVRLAGLVGHAVIIGPADDRGEPPPSCNSPA